MKAIQALRERARGPQGVHGYTVITRDAKHMTPKAFNAKYGGRHVR